MDKKSIHFIAVGGTGMVSCAGIFKQLGYDVRGSDNPLYPPASIVLKQSGIEFFEGFKADNLDWQPDSVVVGNVCTKDHVEAKAARDRGFECYSFPQALEKFIFPERKVLAVCGTHGKTTTTSMLSHCISILNPEDSGYLIGGQAKGFDLPYKAGKRSGFFAIEGDEYDSSYFDKQAKFLRYCPFGAIVTSCEWDHIDIYKSEKQYRDSFNQLFQLNGLQIKVLNGDDSQVKSLSSGSDTVFYGENPGNHYYFETNQKGITFYINKSAKTIQFMGDFSKNRPWIGRHNCKNACAVFALLCEAGFDPLNVVEALMSFRGVKRRQDQFHKVDEQLFFDDFAHHPTAIKVTLEAFRESYPTEQIWSVFEPRSNTSQTKLHQNQMPSSFDSADGIIIAPLHRPERIEESNRLDRQWILDQLVKAGKKAFLVDNYDEIIPLLKEHCSKKAKIVFMSNGAFGGIYQKVKNSF